MNKQWLSKDVTVQELLEAVTYYFNMDVSIYSATVGDMLDHYPKNELDTIPAFIMSTKVKGYDIDVDIGTWTHTLCVYI